MADQWSQPKPGWVPPPDGQVPQGAAQHPAGWKKLTIAISVYATVAIVVIAVAVTAIWRATRPPEVLTEREWAKIEEVRDSVPAPAGFEKDYERRYGGDGCSWGPSCEGDPESSQFFDPSADGRPASCDDLRAVLNGHIPGTFRLEKQTANECVFSAEIGRLDVTASLYSRGGTQWYIVTAGDR